MKVVPNKTTQVNKPDKNSPEPLAPQTPDSNRPDLGRPTKKVTVSKSNNKTSKK